MADAAKADATPSGTGVDLNVAIEKDGLSASDQTPGLAAVYAGKACAAAADDISDLLITATNDKPLEVLVVTGGSILADSELATALRFEVAALQDRLLAARVDIESIEVGRHVKDLKMTKLGRPAYLVPLVMPILGAALRALPAGAGLLSKLIAHQYTTSSATVDHPALGLDFRVAGSLRQKIGASTSARVFVERCWEPPDSGLIDGMTKLAHAHRELSSKLVAAAALVESTRTALDEVTTAKAAGQSLLVELCKTTSPEKAPDKTSTWPMAWDYANSLANQSVAGEARAHAEAAAKFGELQALSDDLATFIASTLVAPVGESSNLSRAMRAEWLVGDAKRVALYVGTLAAGLDQVLETKLGPDKRIVLAGTSVEYAAFGSDLTLMFSGVFDSLWRASMSLNKLSELTAERIDYVAVPNAQRKDPPNK
jgi:hypothetical protein